MPLFLAACAASGGDAAAWELQVEAAPANPQAAVVRLDTGEACEVVVRAELDDGSLAWRVGPSTGAVHEVLVPGLKAGRTWTFTAEVDCGDAAGTAGPATWTAGPPPDDLPPFTCEVADPDRLQPGITVLAPVPARDPADRVLYFGLDEDCDVVFSYTDPPDGATADTDAKQAADGHLVLQFQDDLREIDPGGALLAEYVPPFGTRIHHDGDRLPDGGWLALTTEVRSLEVDGMGTVAVTGDVVIELDADGRERWRWSTFDHLDTDRYPGDLSRSTRLDGSLDWTHANAVSLLDDDTLLLSARHQDQLYAIDRATGELLWTLGADGDFALEEGDWFYSQHAPEWHDDGTLVVYDNGNERPGDDPPASRVAVYRVDAAARTAALVRAEPMPAYTAFLGDADLLDNGDLLATAGGPDDPAEPARVLEIDPQGEVLLALEFPDHLLYRARRHARTWLAP